MSSAPGQPKIRATARVRVVLDVAIADCWGEDCPMDQVYRQAATSAVGELRRVLLVNGRTTADDPKTRPRVELIGEPIVTAVLAEQE